MKNKPRMKNLDKPSGSAKPTIITTRGKKRKLTLDEVENNFKYEYPGLRKGLHYEKSLWCSY